MPDTFHRIQREPSVSSAGAVTYTDTEGTGTACQLAPMSGRERETASQLKLDASWKLAYPVSATLAAKDQVRIGSRRFEVAHIEDAYAWAITNVALLQELT